MKQNKVLLKVTIDNNELQLVEEKAKVGYKYAILWREKGNEVFSRTPLKTPSGRNISASKSRKMFMQAIDTAKHFTFKKMTLEEILERTEQINNR